MNSSNKIYIIAEIGVNHNGSFELAKKLINSAKKSNADCVKFQFFNSENLVLKNSGIAKYQNINTKEKNQYKLLKKLEIDKNFLKKIKNYCFKKKIDFLCSFFDHHDLRYYTNLFKIKLVKIPSGELNNLLFLKTAAKLNKITLLSTGMANIKEVEKAYNYLISNNLSKQKIFILHCTTSYPTKNKEINLNVLKQYKKRFGTNIGFSDHSLGIDASIYSVLLGARYIEKHFTLSKKDLGPDHSSSLEPSEFTQMVDKIRSLKEILGNENKKPTQSEIINKRYVRKAIYAKSRIKKGEYFSEKNLILLRPLLKNSLDSSKIEKVIGKKSRFEFKKNQIIKI